MRHDSSSSHALSWAQHGHSLSSKHPYPVVRLCELNQMPAWVSGCGLVQHFACYAHHCTPVQSVSASIQTAAALQHLPNLLLLRPSSQVGACIVSQDNIILSIGYNGLPRGCPDSKLPWSKKARSGSILDTKYPYVRPALETVTSCHEGQCRVLLNLYVRNGADVAL